MTLTQQLRRYKPYNEQEERDRVGILDFIEQDNTAFDRTNSVRHVTASAWIVNHEHNKVLMIYHKIYNSWSWTGGHADGEKDLLQVAKREAVEETGIHNIKPVTEAPFSLEILTVDGHEKNGKYVSSHLHMNVTYLFEADESDRLTVCEAENLGVKWFTFSDALEASTEPWFVSRIYRKLNSKFIEKYMESSN